jgi:dihydroorotate dehydrogenase electron transfer subunit
MMRAVAESATAAGHPVFVSLEPVMGCGMGGCYSCVVPIDTGKGPHLVRACLEGPVFDGRIVAWNRLRGH